MSSFGASLYRSIASSNSVSNATNFIGEITKHGHNFVSSAITGGVVTGTPNPQSTEMNLEAVKIQVTVSISFHHVSSSIITELSDFFLLFFFIPIQKVLSHSESSFPFRKYLPSCLGNCQQNF